jgi:hypothetical protein
MPHYPHTNKQENPWCTPLLTLATVLPGLTVAHHFMRPWLAARVLEGFADLVPVVIV